MIFVQITLSASCPVKPHYQLLKISGQVWLVHLEFSAENSRAQVYFFLRIKFFFSDKIYTQHKKILKIQKKYTEKNKSHM